jgi:ATP-binding cassette subfamily B (MDR/TAP) protein 1
VANLFSILETVVVAIFISAKILTYTGDVTRMRMSLKAMQEWFDRVPQDVVLRTYDEKDRILDDSAGFSL